MAQFLVDCLERPLLWQHSCYIRVSWNIYSYKISIPQSSVDCRRILHFLSGAEFTYSGVISEGYLGGLPEVSLYEFQAPLAVIIETLSTWRSW